MENHWLSVDKIAAYLGTKRDTVCMWIAEKGMPAHRVGRLWKFRRSEVNMGLKERGCFTRSIPVMAETEYTLSKQQFENIGLKLSPGDALISRTIMYTYGESCHIIGVTTREVACAAVL